NEFLKENTSVLKAFLNFIKLKRNFTAIIEPYLEYFNTLQSKIADSGFIMSLLNGLNSDYTRIITFTGEEHAIVLNNYIENNLTKEKENIQISLIKRIKETSKAPLTQEALNELFYKN